MLSTIYVYNEWRRELWLNDFSQDLRDNHIVPNSIYKFQFQNEIPTYMLISGDERLQIGRGEDQLIITTGIY